MTQKYKTKSGAIQFMPSLSWVDGVMRSDNITGFCLACGCEQGGVEPDARRYKCDACGFLKVYGAAELAYMGLFHLDDGADKGEES